jgi:hypothetical protein
MPQSSWNANAKRRLVWVGTVVTILAISAGWLTAASLTITTGSSENGGGTYHATSSLSYWTEASVGIATEPSSLPAVLSTTSGSPTVLAGSGQNYAINTPTASDIAQFWKFTEGTSAPASTEIELQFTVSTGLTPVITQVTAYLETQATAPGTAQTFVLYFDLGAVTSNIVLNSVTEIGQQCSSVGSCP